MSKISLLIGLVFLASLSVAQNENLSLSPRVLLPDGGEFKTWRNTTEFTKTFIVDNNHAFASDNNPGTADKPFLTINRAAQVVRPGQRIVIHSGVYREKVVPKNEGQGPDRMISYEAARGSRVIIKGSRVLESTWLRSRNPAQFSEKLWMTTLPDSIFSEISPFTLQNASAADIEIMPWATEWSGRVPYTLRRGLVFQDGRRLAQLAVYEDLVRLPGSFWVDSTGTVLHIHPFEGRDPNQAVMEVTVQQHLFKPDRTDLGYIQVKGITFMHAGNGFPRTGVGALFTMGGHHWIIENNNFEQINSVAVEIGARSIETSNRELSRKDSQRSRQSPGYTIVRNNIIYECGTGGIEGYVNYNALVENNHIYNIGWQDVERYWECAAIKLLVTNRSLVRRNLIHDVEAASAIWLDWDNKYCRITQNTVYDMSMCCNGALYIEASQVPNMIDHNIVWDTHGVAIYCGDSDSLTIAYNLIGPCSNDGVLTRAPTNRELNGRILTSRHNRLINNIFYADCPVMFDDPDNQSDQNIFSVDFDFEFWQAQGYDKQSKQIDFQAYFDRKQLQIKIESKKPFPVFDNEPLSDTDFYDNPREKKAKAGPFQYQNENQIIFTVDPRR